MQRKSTVDLFIVGTIFFVQLFNTATPTNVTSTTRSPCPVLRCTIVCPNKFVIDQNGCPTCECNPCRFGQPLLNVPCGQGQGQCGSSTGLCKVSNLDRAYCCSSERPGSCPQGPNSAVVLCPRKRCETDYNCPNRQKCCGPCFTCVNATEY